MGNEIKHPIRNGIIISVSAMAFGYLASLIPGAWQWFVHTSTSIWGTLWRPATVNWWLIIVLAIGCLPLIVNIFRYITRQRGPHYTDYCEDRFFGVVWRWRYNSRQPTDLWCFCAQCDTTLVYSEDHPRNSVWFTCEHCGVCRHEERNGLKHYALSKVYRQIDRKLRSGEWTKQV